MWKLEINVTKEVLGNCDIVKLLAKYDGCLESNNTLLTDFGKKGCLGCRLRLGLNVDFIYGSVFYLSVKCRTLLFSPAKNGHRDNLISCNHHK